MKSNRREFLKTSAFAGAGLFAFPSVVPASVIGKNAPSNKLNIAAIGTGRIARGWNMTGVLNSENGRLIAVCDVDSKRLADAKKLVEDFYTDNKKNIPKGIKTYSDYREMLQNKNIDAVIISTPDHWHAKCAIDSALAGKHIYLEKPATLTYEEGRILSNIVHRTGVVFQLGTQQRSWEQFRLACQAVQNRRIGTVKTIKVGLPIDPSGNVEPIMSVPSNLNYQMWLGPTKYIDYTEKRVHPQSDYSRPGWLRCEQFCLGMITGWGVHHIDIAHWGMGTEYTGPVELKAEAQFPEKGIWTVHGKYHVEAKYANGVTMHISNEFPNGVRFEGTDGWVFVTRGDYKVTKSDPNKTDEKTKQPLQSSNPDIIKEKLGKNEKKLYVSENHHNNWIDSSINGTPNICPVEIGHRSTGTCIISHIAMKLKRKLYWNPLRERFANDDEANAMLSRPQRPPYMIDIK